VPAWQRRYASALVSDPRPSLILSIDLEDWNQIVHRDLGLPDWDRPYEAFERQVTNLLAFLDELDLRATFFALGICAKNYPDVAREIAARGHEIASHGFAHVRVANQGPDEFRRDVEESIDLIESLVGDRPTGYRAPAFSISRTCAWAFDILADLGFRYDSSQYDTPRVPARIDGIPAEPYRLTLPSGRTLTEFPVAVGRLRGRSIPIGGGSYWRMLPKPLLFRALRSAAGPSAAPVLYFHPYEFDPRPLAASLPAAAPAQQRLGARRANLYWNARRPRIARLLREVAADFRFITYEDYLAAAGERDRARTKTLSGQGVLV
jgi:polysaccharide deacetylase family protein (PEP-CTERM system associated)